MTTSNQYPPECTGAASCGTNGRYAKGCRGDACGLARVEYQRRRRGTIRAQPSKYQPQTPPEYINRWKELLGR